MARLTSARPRRVPTPLPTPSPTARDALGIIRVEVVAASTLPPVAENDTAVLPQGGSVLVAPLGNDYDPAGGLLSIRELQMEGKRMDTPSISPRISHPRRGTCL